MSRPGFFFSLVLAVTAVFAGEADQILSATGVKNGLCIHVGSGDGSTTVGLHNNGKIVVVGLDTDKAKVVAARKAARSGGLYGLVSFDWVASCKELPFKTNLATLVVVDADALGAQAPSEAEVLRVVHPSGIAYIKKGGQWTKTTKPFPSEYGSWAFWDHGPDGNASSDDRAVDMPRGFQWMGGWDAINTISGAQRIWRQYYAIEERTNSKTKASRNMVRNSFNGIPLWTRANVGKMSPHFIYDGKVYLHRSGTLPMTAYDLATGDSLASFSQGAIAAAAGWSINNGQGLPISATVGAGILVQGTGSTLYGLDARTGALRWTAKASANYIGNPVLDTVGKRVFAIECDAAPQLARWPFYGQAKSVASFNLATGALLWRTPATANNLSQLVYYKGKVAVIASVCIGGINHDRSYGAERKTALLNAADGNVLWVRPYNDAAYNGMIRNDTVLLPGSSEIRAYAIATGDSSKWGTQNQGCMRVVTTPKYIQFGHLGFVDGVSSGNWSYNFFQRPSCATGIYPANGMWYGATNPRCFCVAMYRTNQAWDCTPPAAPLDDSRRLTSGSMLPGAESGAVTTGTAIQSTTTADWNFGIYGSDTGIVVYRLEKELAAVNSGDIGYVVIPHEHRIEARKGGAAVWSYTAGGRIIGKPLASNGKVYFGSRDGYVYCLNGSDGSPRWRFLGAANDKRIVINSQVESAWPVANVVLYKNSITFAAGLTMEADGGSYFYGLDPETGAIKWKFRLFTPNLKGTKGTKPRGVPNLTQPNVLTHWLESSNDALSIKWVVQGRGGYAPKTRSLSPEEWNGKTIDIVTATTVLVNWRNQEVFARNHGKVLLGDNWFEVPTAGMARVSLLSINGRTMQVLYQGNALAGRTMFNPGRPTTAGTYVLKLDWSGGAVAHRPVLR